MKFSTFSFPSGAILRAQKSLHCRHVWRRRGSCEQIWIFFSMNSSWFNRINIWILCWATVWSYAEKISMEFLHLIFPSTQFVLLFHLSNEENFENFHIIIISSDSKSSHPSDRIPSTTLSLLSNACSVHSSMRMEYNIERENFSYPSMSTSTLKL